jgi:ABC-type uncharacterized transport system substrate-binding protein
MLLVLGFANKAMAHPHVFIEANLEVVRDVNGNATDIRHVWRFDDLFTASLVLDFDENGSGVLEQEELDTIARDTKISIAEYNFFTEIRNGGEIVEFETPDPYFIDFDKDQLILVMSMKLVKPSPMKDEGFMVAVSDPTYYVAVALREESPFEESSVQVSGNGENCTSKIIVPDFDALYERDAERMAKLFDAGPDEEVEASDDYLTWVHFSCKS